jgi:hypothetical protein
VELATKTAVAHASIARGPAGERIGGLSINGDWVDDRIVAAATGLSGYVTLTRSGSGLRVTSVRDLGRTTFPWRVEDPLFTSDGGVMVTAYAPGGKWGGKEAGHVVTCFDDGCRSFNPGGTPIAPKRVHNPSRASEGAS